MNRVNREKIIQRSLFDTPVPDRAADVGIEYRREEPHRLPTADNGWAGINDLGELRESVLSCRRCPLREGARGVVFGEGNAHARVMLVGEGPGQTEDATGRPFVGRAGQMLERGLKVAEFRREDIFIANIVKCRPPGNRLPSADEVQMCLPHLMAQIRIISPECVVLLGALSSQTLVCPSLRVTRDRGKWYEKSGINFLVTFHPAAVLRDMSGRTELFLDDFRSLKVRLRKTGHASD